VTGIPESGTLATISANAGHEGVLDPAEIKAEFGSRDKRAPAPRLCSAEHGVATGYDKGREDHP
jgi:hypothetical protein